MPIAKHFYALPFIHPHKIIIAANDKPKKAEAAEYSQLWKNHTRSVWMAGEYYSIAMLYRSFNDRNKAEWKMHLT